MHPQDLKRAYDRGENITALLKGVDGTNQNTEEIIELAYDLQTGSYVKALDDPSAQRHKELYTRAIADVFRGLGPITSLLEAGVGEGTTLSHVLDAVGSQSVAAFGFDLAWSRVRCARSWLNSHGHREVGLAAASLFHIPYADSSFDVVYTSHSIEPNGGHESAILAELFRVTSRYLVLLEPGYELAPGEARKRMEAHGYCRNLVGHAEQLGMKVLRHELFPHSGNSLNPTALTVIEKSASASPAVPEYACPWFRTALRRFPDCFFSEESARAYPIVGGIPCLRREAAVIASKYLDYSAEG